MWPKQFQQCKVPAMIGYIMVVGAMTRCPLLLAEERYLIQEIMLHKFEQSHNATETF